MSQALSPPPSESPEKTGALLARRTGESHSKEAAQRRVENNRGKIEEITAQPSKEVEGL